MSWNFKDLTGKRYGRLVVSSRDNSKTSKVSWICRCDCGNQKSVTADNLRSGNTVSCGCFSNDSRIARKTTHGMTKTRIYRIWLGMIQRCTNKKELGYINYGGRGVSVCDRWLHSFENFLADMGECPDKMQIDRIDNNGNYEPSNCRWVSVKDNCRNRRSSRILNYNGISQTAAAWSEQTKIRSGTILYRIDVLGWSVEKALNSPVKLKRRNK